MCEGGGLTPPLYATFKEGSFETIRLDGRLFFQTFALILISPQFFISAKQETCSTVSLYKKINWSQILLEVLLPWSYAHMHSWLDLNAQLLSGFPHTSDSPWLHSLFPYRWRVYRFNANFRAEWITSRGLRFHVFILDNTELSMLPAQTRRCCLLVIISCEIRHKALFRSDYKVTRSAAHCSQALGQTPQTLLHIVSLLRQCASNYRVPQARVCNWQHSCAAGGTGARRLKIHVRQFNITPGGATLSSLD